MPGHVLSSRAPGRVNLIGEHTDYNDGFVLPLAIDAYTVVAAAPVDGGGLVEIESEAFGRVSFRPDGRGPDGEAIDASHWSAHLAGMHHLLHEAGVEVPPWTAAIATDVPIGASLSTSAAVLVSSTNAALAIAGVEWDPIDVVQLCRRVENEILGLPSGIMDHMISATAVEGAATLIDCRSLETSHHRIPTDAAVVVLDTMSRRELVDSEFALRREQSAAAAELLGVASLRDVGVDDVGRLDDELLRRRARHVVTENDRTVDAAAAMDADDAVRVGELMNAAHVSIRDDYEVSGPELDAMVEIAQSVDGCFGARMTGGGFAGCAIALVHAGAVSTFVAEVEHRFETDTGTAPTVWPVHPSSGATVRPADRD